MPYGLPDRDAARCPRDGAPRNIFQPDEDRPLRLLLVCTDCGSWSILAGTALKDGAIDWTPEAEHFAPFAVAVAG